MSSIKNKISKSNSWKDKKPSITKEMKLRRTDNFLKRRNTRELRDLAGSKSQRTSLTLFSMKRESKKLKKLIYCKSRKTKAKRKTSR
jgi:hypothetical protein